ncbi:MAG: ABC transporter substrate-binding protein [Gammaproteobacteria bacterium]|mgnify:CR=1 FL=1|nr:ABC transporter substrate-binding protein [Gammaproteobacteria bacterium]MBT4860965.1 ABC transporter substrate-binding protein [Gammaproteobacteria bacterium]MBT6456566.1 ABC transporter substrate-binding protein [Gammaproteobacteria bacterium]MBT6551697.1 ABC transporter substrate-binding protein [Gammaproteobacteria bacterium]MBT7209615.1 ABC transporter substrate-binding protein [Gammaproteobacteria bacterium]
MAKINIMALRHSAFYAPLLMTIKGGYLSKQGLDPIYTVATPDNPIDQNLRAGTAHLSQTAPAISFAALEKGLELDIVHFASINDRDGFYLTAREPTENFQWSDLEGQDVLVDHLFQPHATLRYAMFLNGADFDKVNVIDAGNVEQMDKAFRSGQGAYVHQQGPAPQQLENDGEGFIVASIGEAIGPVAFSSLCATHEWLKTDMAEAFLVAYQQAMTDIIDMPSIQIANTIHDFLPNIDKDVLVTTLDDYKKLDTWKSNISINTNSYENLLKVFLHSGYITKAHPMESCIV